MSVRSERIRALVESSKLSYVELEKITGIKKSSLQRYASGVTTKIPLDVIEKLSKAFNVSQEYLMGWDEKENPDQLVLTGIETEMIKWFRQFPNVEQKLLVIMMQNLYSVPADKRGSALETLQAFWKMIQKP